MRATLSLAWPVILAEIGWVLMGVVDTIVVGPLGPAAIGAVGTGTAIFFAVMVLGMGTLYALDTFVSQSFGAGRIDECHRWLYAGLWLAGGLSAILIVVLLGVVMILPAFGMHPDVLGFLQPYLRALAWSVPAVMVHTVLRRYLQAMDIVRPLMAAMVLANLVNLVANAALVYGRFGAPTLGVIGSAYATFGARVVMAGMLAWFVFRRERQRPTGLHDVPFAPEYARMWRLIRLGAPAASQMALEVGVFATAGALAARISPLAAAANQIVLNIASLFFMVPLGLSAAAAVRVGQAVGRADGPGAERAGWAALGLAFVAALATIAIMLIGPRLLLGVFTADASVVAMGVTLLALCAVFQPFDGFQVVATGALRGVGDTRTPMLCNLVGHWFVGLPLAYTLCFVRGWGVTGLWTGLSIGLILIGVALMWTWHRKARLVARALVE